MHRRRFSLHHLLSSLFCLGLCFSLLLPRAIASAASPSLVINAEQEATQVQRGVDSYHAGNYVAARYQWERALATLPNEQHSQQRLILLENLARVSQQLGQLPEAVDYWKGAIATAIALDDRPTQARLMVEEAQTYNRLGRHRRAMSLLCGSVETDACVPNSAVALTRAIQNPLSEVAALGSLGESYRLLGQYEPALASFSTAQQLVALLDQTDVLSYQVAIHKGLGQVHDALARLQHRRAATAMTAGDAEFSQTLARKALSSDQAAKQSLEQGLLLVQQQPSDQALAIQLQLIPLYQRLGESRKAQEVQANAYQQLIQQPDSQQTAFAAIALANLLAPSAPGLGRSQASCAPGQGSAVATELLQRGLAIAQRIGDRRSQAFAQGQLGHLAECGHNYDRAWRFTQAARAASVRDPTGQDSAYLWDWQLGRILKAQGKSTQAINAYRSAVSHLDEIRSDIATADRELQFNFRDGIEPIYRELADLELLDVPASKLLPAQSLQHRSVRQTLNTVDSLKLTELQNYFGDDCIVAPATKSVLAVNASRSETAIISTIIFPQRTAVIASFPDGSAQVEWLEVDQQQLEKTVTEFRRGLESFFRDFDPRLAQRLYGWLLSPFEAQLQQRGVKTLVFVHDGMLRSIPMAALHDGQQFLVERYAVTTTPSLELTASKPQDIARLQALVLGLTDEVTVDNNYFAPLPFVSAEVESVSAQLSNAQTLLNRQFSRDRLQKELSQTPYPILHIATHGHFGAEPESNFIVTGNGEKLTISELDQLIRKLRPTGEPIELLALTACETAIGDERATLGLAGVAIQAGAKSAIASLWSINDHTTSELVRDFYRELLDAQVSKAEALRAAQIAQISKGGMAAHPARWAPLILIGNWL